MTSRFLFNEAIWDEYANRVPKAKLVRAAVAYLGSDASSLLPLGKGDKLVVDMSLRSVRSGATDPKEVRKLLRRGVHVFSRGTLHAKFVIIDRVLVAGSANISSHAHSRLDECAVLTDDHAAVRRATAVFEQLCTEPVRKEYLDKCIAEYRPPRIPVAKGDERTTRKRLVQAKLWIHAGLRYTALPAAEQEAAERAVRRFERQLLDFEHAEVDYSHYPKQQKLFRSLRVGDWLIQCVRDGAGYEVSPPCRFLGIESCPRKGGKLRYLLVVESPTQGDTIRWAGLRKLARAEVPALDRDRPRTTAITDDAQADALLRLWNARGKLRRRRA